MKWIKTFIAMVQFFTRIPIKVNLGLEKQDFGRGLIFAPIVGAIIGGYLCLLNLGLGMVFPQVMSAVFVIIGYIIITSGLHLDGLGDTFDGIFSNRPKEQMLEIMRDSRVGTNAVLGVFSVLLINYATLSSLPSSVIVKALILMPVAGRIGSVVGAGLNPYARSGEGLGKTFVDYCGAKEVIIGFLLSLTVFYLVLGINGLIIAVVPLISATGTSRFFASKINGVTGDVLGAVCEINQAIFLVVFFVLNRFGILH